MDVRTKVIITLLTTSILGGTTIGYATFYFAEKQLVKVQKEKLEALASHQKKNIRDSITFRMDKISLIANRKPLQQSFSNYIQTPNKSDYLEMKEVLSDFIENVAEIRSIHLCDTEGSEIISVQQASITDSGCHSYFNNTDKKAIQRKIWMEKNNGIQYLILNRPIIIDGDTIGIVKAFSDANEILDLVSNYSGLGTTGETLIARRGKNNEAVFLTPLRYNTNKKLVFSTAPNKVNAPIIQALKQHEKILENENTLDYRGVVVLAATTYIPEADWGLVVKMDRDDVLKPVNSLLLVVTILVLNVCTLAIVIGSVFGRSITQPIITLGDIAKKTREGDLSVRTELKRTDEFGYLARILNDMLDSLANKITALETNEKRLRSIFDAVIDGIVTLNKEGAILSVNSAAEKLFQYRSDELIYKELNFIIPNIQQIEIKDRTQHKDENDNKKTTRSRKEMIGVRKDRSRFSIEIEVNEIVKPEIDIYVITLRDISEKEKTESNLRDLEQRHDLALRGLSVGIWDWNVEDNSLFWSERFKEIIGIKSGEFVPHFNEFADRLHNEDRDRTLAAVEAHLVKQEPYDIEYRLKHNQGHYVWIHAQGQAVWDEHGAATRMVGSVDDISEKKDALIALEESRSFLTLMMNSNPDLIFVKDEQFKIIEANPAFLEVYPEPMRDQIFGTTTVESHEENDAEEFLKMDKLAFNQGFSEVIEKINFPDGRIRTFHTQKILFENPQKKRFLLGIGRDVTEREQLIERLTESNEELEEFAYRTSHDLRSPLVSSIRLIDIANDAITSGKSSVAHKSLSHVQKSLRKLEVLVQDILTLTQAKNKEEKDEPVDINVLLDSAIEKLSYLENFDRLSIERNIQFYEKLPFKRGRLALIFENLISNSIKYQDINEPNPYIHISAYLEEGSFIFKVQDNGLGIPKNQNEKLFTMFKRFHTRVSFGSGLGLYMMKKSAEVLGGEISYSDPGIGTLFTFKAPIPK